MTCVQPNSLQVVKPEVQEFLPNMPDELALNVLQYLTPKELLSGACLVSKKWKALAYDDILWQSFDLKTIFPGINIISEDTWANHADLERLGLSFKGLKPLDIRKALPKILKVASLKTEEGGITIMSVPSGLSMYKYKDFLSFPSKFHPFSFIEYYGRKELENLKSETILEPYQVVITDSILQANLHAEHLLRRRMNSWLD